MCYDFNRLQHPVLSWLVWLTSVALCLANGASAQTSDDATGSAESGVKTSALDLTGPSTDPFSHGLTLQAHKLRGLTAEVAGLVLRGDSGGPIAFEALATPLRGNDGKAHVQLFVEIDGPSFLESNQAGNARVEIYAYALGAGQSIGGFLAEVFVVDIRDLGEAVWQSGLKYYGHLELPTGDYKLRILVRNYQSKVASLQELPLKVPSNAEFDRPFILPPLFSPPSGRDSWLPVREWSPPEGDYPFVIDQQALRPVARPVLATGRKVEAHLMAYGLPSGKLSGQLELSRGAAPVSPASLEVLRREADHSRGIEILTIGFEVPTVEPGKYDLRVALSARSPEILSLPTSVVVVQKATADHGLLWTDLRGQLTSPVQVTAAVEAPAVAQKEVRRRGKNRKRDKRIEHLAAAYRQALAKLGSGQRAAARSAILNMEAEVLTDGAIDSLQTAELRVAKELAESEVESLIPVMVLHDEIYMVYRQRNLFSLGSNARILIEKLAELYAEHGGSEGSRIVAGRALASLGGRLQRANLPSSSRRLYQRALTHDPGNKAAALGLATSFERYSEYRQAVEVLENLVRIHPAYGEGLLRLAINLQRLGLLARTKDLLRRVIGSDSPDWVRALASQELARSLMVAGDLVEATELLEKSVEEMPDQQASKYLLAHLYDRQRQAIAALDLLSSVAPTSGDSARKIYDGWPRQPLDTVRGELSEAADVRSALVAKILQNLEPVEGR